MPIVCCALREMHKLKKLYELYERIRIFVQLNVPEFLSFRIFLKLNCLLMSKMCFKLLELY